MTDALFDKIQAIAATPGKNDKVALLRGMTEADRVIIRWALSPEISFYIAKLDPVEDVGSGEEWGPEEFQLLERLSKRELTGNEALRQVGFSLRELSYKSAELLRRVILKDLRAGFGASSMNKAYPRTVPEHSYMRCSLPKDSNIKKWEWAVGIFSQLKANGMFARIDHHPRGGILITTRQGNTFPAGALKALEEDAEWVLKPWTQTHGELTVWRDGVLLPRSEGNGMLNSVMLGGELEAGCEVRFDAWDQIPLLEAVPKGKYGVLYSKRFADLSEQIAEGGRSRIMLIESTVVYSYEEAMTHYREVLARKLEGTVLKHPDATWRDGDSKDQVKLKLEVDVDLKIVGFRAGEVGKRTEHTFGSVLCQTIDGQLEVAVSGFKRDMEQFLHENRDSVLGKIMCVRANEVSAPCETNELYSLYHPRFVELRQDKAEADSLQRVLAQFESAVSA